MSPVGPLKYHEIKLLWRRPALPEEIKKFASDGWEPWQIYPELNED